MRRSAERRLAVRAVLLALVVPACVLPAVAQASRTAPTARGAVVGGTAASSGQFPWMVALSRGCGGTLIAPDRVLTAGHCVEDLRIADLRLYVGATRRRRGGYRYDGLPVRAIDVASHPRYRSLESGGPVNDVAIIRLAEPVAGAPVVPLAGGDAPDGGGRPATVVGWGVMRTDLARAPLAIGLQHGNLRILSDRACSDLYGRDGSYRRSVMLCARSRNAGRRPNTSPCVGDSGGPLMSSGIQVGIVSFGISCGALGEPTVFARVSRLRAFIDAADPVWAPQPLAAARVAGSVRPGGTATCVPPPFRGRVDRIGYRWGLNGALVATGRRVRVRRTARGKALQCRAVARNAGGSTPSLASSAVVVPRG